MDYLISKIVIAIRDERGQALAEYALIVALIALACVVALGLIGTALDSKLSSFAAGLT